MSESSRAAPGAPSNADLLVPYLLPYGAYVGIASLAPALGLGRAADYALRIVVTAALLLWLRGRLQPLTGPRSAAGSVAIGVVGGLLGMGLWVALLLPFQDPAAGEAYSGPAFALRLAAASLVVPFAEELLFRGYLLGLVVQWQAARRSGAEDPTTTALDRRSVHEIEPGAWSGAAALISAGAFALGHAPVQYPAAFAYGLLMAALWGVRRDLIAPIAAHAVTNFALYLYVLHFERWGLW